MTSSEGYSLLFCFLITLIATAATSPFVFGNNENLNFSQAIQGCQDMGLVLASIHNGTENQQIAELCIQNGKSQCWIGLHRNANEPDFKWIDGSDSTDYAFPWYPGDPSVPLSDSACVWINAFSATWTDIDCSRAFARFICGPQRPITTSQPTTSQPTIYEPSPEPTYHPTTNEPTIDSTVNPSHAPSSEPTTMQSTNPTSNPTLEPTSNPIELFHECPGTDTNCHTDYNLGYRICDERYQSACSLPLTSHCDDPCIFIGPFHECGTDIHCHTNYSLGYASGIRQCDAGYITNCSLSLISDCDDSCKSMSPSNAPTSPPTISKPPFDECLQYTPSCWYSRDKNGTYTTCVQGFITACSTPLTSDCKKPCIPIPITSPFVHVNESVSFDQAIQKCHDMGMVLVSIHNETEIFQVTALCNQHAIEHPHCWVGFRRDANEADFKWIDGSDSTDYQDFPWSSGNPSVDLNRSACTILDSEYPTWDDTRCESDDTYTTTFICGPQRPVSGATSSLSPTADHIVNSSHESTLQPTKPTVIPTANNPSSHPSYTPTTKPTSVPTFTRTLHTTSEPTSNPTPGNSTHPTNDPIPEPLINNVTLHPTTTESTAYYTTRHPTSEPTKIPTSTVWSTPYPTKRHIHSTQKGHWKTKRVQEFQDDNVYYVDPEQERDTDCC